MKGKAISTRIRKLLVLAVVAALMLVFVSPASALAQGNSDETLMRNSVKHYTQALIAYNDGNMSAVPGLLQAAASNAKHVDPDLANLLEQLHECFPIKWPRDGSPILEWTLAHDIAIRYNAYFGQTLIDPGNPTSVPSGETPI